MEGINIYTLPPFKSSILIAGFGGWPNAGEVSTLTLGYLIRKLGATKFAEIEPDEFYIFTSSRPVTRAEDDEVKSFVLPGTELYFSPPGLFLLLGKEPDLRWQKYTKILLDFAASLGVKRIYTIGGEYAQVPHTRPTRIWTVVSEEKLRLELAARNSFQGIDYEGPTCIHTYILVACRERGMECIGLWGDVPHYLQLPNPPARYWMLYKLSGLLSLPLDLEEAEKEVPSFEYQVSRALAKSPEMQSYIRKLEEIYDQGSKGQREVLEGDIVKEAEEFLRRLQREKDEES